MPPTLTIRPTPPRGASDRVVPLPEAALIAGMSPDTLKRCNKRGELKIIKLSPRRVGIRLSDLWAFIDARAC
jgi:hypothetical protein